MSLPQQPLRFVRRRGKAVNRKPGNLLNHPVQCFRRKRFAPDSRIFMSVFLRAPAFLWKGRFFWALFRACSLSAGAGNGAIKIDSISLQPRKEFE
jgi:hypothetical protein